MEITEALETIINARYGREVRQAIHDGIKQAYDDAIQNGNANMEVSQARGGKATLGQRLDEADTQLVQTAQELKTSLYGFEDSLVTLDTRVSDILTTSLTDEVAAQEIIDSRMGEPTLGTKISKIDTLLKPNKVYTYHSGDEMKELTGGWVNGFNTPSNTNLVRSKESDHLLLSFINATSSAETAIVTANVVDVTHLEFLYIDWEQTYNSAKSRVTFALSPNQISNRLSGTNVASTSVNGLFTRRLTTLDVSALSGEYFIKIHAGHTGASESINPTVKTYSVYGVSSKVDRYEYIKKTTSNQVAKFTPSTILPNFGEEPYILNLNSTNDGRQAMLYYDDETYKIPENTKVSCYDTATITRNMRFVFNKTSKTFKFVHYSYDLKTDEYHVFSAKYVDPRTLYVSDGFVHTNEGVAPLPSKSISKAQLADDVAVGLTETNGVPSYYEDELNKVVSDTQNIQTGDSLTFSFITDTHGEVSYHKPAVLRQLNAIKEVSYITDFTYHGGDIINGYSSDKEGRIKGTFNDFTEILVKNRKPVFIAKGNHDDNSYYGTPDPVQSDLVISDKEWYSINIKPFEETYVVNYENLSSPYFYRDFEKQKIRVITLNAVDYPLVINEDGTQKWTGRKFWGYGNEQLNWLAHTALNFESKGDDKANWAVVILSHMTPDEAHTWNQTGDFVKGILNAFETGTSYSGWVGDEWTAQVDVDYTKQGEMDIVGYFAGHVHKDTDFLSQSGKWSYITTTRAYPDDPSNIVDRPSKTINEAAFDVVTINKSERKIYMKRFGYGSDREFTF